MLEVGKVYKLSAPWHRNHGHPVLVVHSRVGVSEVYIGQTVYHIVDNGDFFGEPDWDTEYVESNFLSSELGKMPMERLMVKYANLLSDRKINNDYRSPQIFTYIANADSIQLWDGSFYTAIKDIEYTENMVVNLLRYFDENGNFIEQIPG